MCDLPGAEGFHGRLARQIRHHTPAHQIDDVVPEDYPAPPLADADGARQVPAHTEDAIIRKHDGKGDQLKAEPKRLEGGKIWNHMLKKYFPQSGAVKNHAE